MLCDGRGETFRFTSATHFLWLCQNIIVCNNDNSCCCRRFSRLTLMASLRQVLQLWFDLVVGREERGAGGAGEKLPEKKKETTKRETTKKKEQQRNASQLYFFFISFVSTFLLRLFPLRQWCRVNFGPLLKIRPCPFRRYASSFIEMERRPTFEIVVFFFSYFFLSYSFPFPSSFE